MNKVPEISTIIRFPDCDPFNHLNNARYLDYFINAREDHLIKEYDFNLYAHALESKQSWVVSQNQIAYLSPAFLMERVYIQSTMLEWNEKSIRVEMRMWDEKKTRLKALLWSRFNHFDLKTQRSIEHSEELIKRFRDLENPLHTKMTFEERVAQIRMLSYEEV